MAYIGKGLDNGVRNQFVYAATQGQTAFTGADSDGKTLAMTDILYVDCYQNGVKLKPTTDYTVSSTTLTLVNAASLNDVINIVSFDTFAVPDTVSASTGGTFVGQVTFTADTTFADGADIVTASAGTSNFRAGVNAGNSIQAGGNYNVVIGDEAGTALTTGDDNVAIGFEALSTEDTGTRAVAVGYRALKTQNNDSTNYNIAIGYDAGLSVTTGTQNVIIGGKAGDALTVGDDNVAIGRAALTTDTQGSNSTAVGMNALATQNFTSATNSDNVAVGYNAGTAITTGVQNTILGALAGDALTTSSRNVAVGYEALSTATAYNENTAVGYRALRVNTDGYSNTAVGVNSLLANTTGHSNVAVGHAAGTAVTTGDENVIIGMNAGLNLTTGNYNILIGHNPRTSQVDSEKQIVMGRDVVGAGGDHFTFGDGSTDSAIEFGATSITAPSDQRYKEDIATATAGLAFIKDLRPVTFKWKKEKDLPTSHRAYVEGSESRTINDYTNHGFIAQEVKAVIDAHSEIKDGFDMWSTDEQADGGRQRIGDASLMPIMVKAVQELSKKNDALEARLAALESA